MLHDINNYRVSYISDVTENHLMQWMTHFSVVFYTLHSDIILCNFLPEKVKKINFRNIRTLEIDCTINYL